MDHAYIEQLKKHGRPKRIRQYVATMLFWAVTIALVVLTSQNSRWFNPQVRPIPFYSIIAALIVAPILHFELYRLVPERTYHGTVVECREKNVLKHDGKDTKTIRGAAVYWHLNPTVGYEIKVKDTLNILHRYTFKGEREVAYAKERYRVGDAVIHVVDCKFPIHDRPPTERTELCAYCGYLDKQILEHTHCPNCNMKKYGVVCKND